MKLSRLWVNILTVLIYIGSQLFVLIPTSIFIKQGHDSNTAFLMAVPYYVGSFVVASLLVIFINTRIKNKTRVERSVKTDTLSTIGLIVGGFFISLFAQMMLGMINTYILNQPLESQNTTQIMGIAKQAPIFIILIAIVGPILEEFVFRKVIFGEIYDLIKGNRGVAFVISVLISGFIFSAAHSDFNHTLIYMGMSVVFSGLYVLSNRIIVPIAAHMLMNGFVVLMQVVFADKVIEAQKQLEQVNFIMHLFH
ncbi:CPBP family intramembrane metalloprotease [Macrococcus armenti]|uniref:intramembrane glutamic endopeptidase MroQ n=1 Tax=Macrococcus armenti TaxID=2875764 RepID=UPI001CCF1279|nr:type II CAAX endopeptidase family protein [Macrococcus armenti]UBH08343.1 CPBP family intramembrane metalloprotease [Macrococcus armenti]UBH10574.1 CPBP family intramembrane metalloprotease [Macrococcus armenti]UBH15111.1 CPBP family intramembrane metalloprotease [Macrococcus armenti]UBH17472.1 CPBP family intramembrane metalloprotease [Macrococcus armenti]UBH19736.1 CPBP family intramembrane metalloprotease [Macrococcus armenti]